MLKLYIKLEGMEMLNIYNPKKIKKYLDWEPKYNNINKILTSAINWEKN